MTVYGLTPEGFVVKPLDVIHSEIQADFQSKFGNSINLASRSFLGGLSALMADREASLWEQDEAIYRSQDPDAATGDALEGISAITGTIREGATNSLVTETMVGTPGTVLSAGRVISVVDLGTKFQTIEEATIAAVPAWTPSTAYTLGQFVTNGARVYLCITAGNSAGSGGPLTTAADITDGTVHWRHLGSGTGMVQVTTEAQSTGPIPALSGTLTVIETPVGGWSAAINLLDADKGRDIESDPELRVRRADEVTGEGKGAVDAIRARVLREVPETTSVTVFQNTSMTTDGDGVPPKSVEVLVRGGDDQKILESIFRAVGAGIETHGNVSGTVVDSAGISHTVKFSRPVAVDIYVIADVLKVTADFPSDGEDQVKTAIVDFGDTYAIGRDVYARALGKPVFDIPGVLNVSSVKIGLAPAPGTENTIVITSRQLATFDTSRVSVNLSSGTP